MQVCVRERGTERKRVGWRERVREQKYSLSRRRRLRLRRCHRLTMAVEQIFTFRLFSCWGPFHLLANCNCVRVRVRVCVCVFVSLSHSSTCVPEYCK